MPILIELPPAEEAQITAFANREGVPVVALIRNALESYQRKRNRSDDPNRPNAAILELQKKWAKEDAMLSQEERDAEDALFADIEKEGIPRMKVS